LHSDDRDPDRFAGEDDPYAPVEYDSPAGERPVAGDDVGERLERVERKVGVRSYAGAIALVIALAGAMIAVALAINARDESATRDDLQELKTRVSQSSAEAVKEAQDKLAELSGRVDQLSGSIDDLQNSSADTDSEISGIQSDIEDLQGQISDIGSSSPGDSGGISPGDENGGSGGAAGNLGDILGGGN
jgi:TolA-binding protein